MLSIRILRSTEVVEFTRLSAKSSMGRSFVEALDETACTAKRSGEWQVVCTRSARPESLSEPKRPVDRRAFLR